MLSVAETPRRRTLRARAHGAAFEDARVNRRRPPGRSSEVRRASIGGKLRRPCKERVRDGFVFFGLARTGRVNQPAASRDGVRRLAQHLKLRRGQQREIALATPPPDVGIPPQDAQTGTGRVDEHTVESTRERQRPQQIRLHEPHVRGAARGDRATQQLHAPVPHVARDQQPGVPHRGREGDVSCHRATRRHRARSDRDGRPRAAATSCEASSCTTNQPASAPAPASGCPFSTMKPSGANRAGRTTI